MEGANEHFARWRAAYMASTTCAAELAENARSPRDDDTNETALRYLYNQPGMPEESGDETELDIPCMNQRPICQGAVRLLLESAGIERVDCPIASGAMGENPSENNEPAGSDALINTEEAIDGVLNDEACLPHDGRPYTPQERRWLNQAIQYRAQGEDRLAQIMEHVAEQDHVHQAIADKLHGRTRVKVSRIKHALGSILTRPGSQESA